MQKDVEFMNWVTPRVGPVNAVNFAHSARINAVVEVLIEKGLVTKEEMEAKLAEVFEKIKSQCAAMPVVSPMQNRPLV